MKVNPVAIQFARARSPFDIIRQDLIRCGFELEFHALNGFNENDTGEFDSDQLYEDIRERYDENELIDYVSPDERNKFAIAQAISEAKGCPITEAYAYLSNSLLSNSLLQEVYRAVSQADEAYRDHLESILREENDYHSPSMKNSFDIASSLYDLVEIGSDSSVDGGELRTRGAITPTQFIRIAKSIFARNDFEIDTGCSFHIHLSIPGINHKYSADFQAEIMAYLLSQTHRFPSALKDRLESTSLREYADFKAEAAKYTAVNFHSRLKTWEFRVFGNINNTQDAKRCLLLAIEALHHAYRVKFSLEKSLMSRILSYKLIEIFDDMLDQHVSFDKAKQGYKQYSPQLASQGW